jgi:hypothetical protein
MVKLAVDENDRPDPGVSKLARRLKLREGFELGEDIGRRVDDYPASGVHANRDRGLGSRLYFECALA